MDQKVTIIAKANGTLDVINYGEAPNLFQGFLVGATLIISVGLNFSFFSSLINTESFKNDVGTQLLASSSLLSTINAFINHTLSLMFLFSSDVMPLTMYLSLCRYSAAFSLFYLLQPGIYIASLTLVVHPQRCFPQFKLLLIVIPLIYTAMIPPIILLFPQMTPVRHITNRIACGVVGANSVFAGGVLLLGFLIPWFVIGYKLIISRCWLFMDDKESIVPVGLFSNSRKLMPTIIFLYIVLVNPHAVLVILSQFTTSHYQRYELHRIDSSVYTTPEDTIFIWLRYQFDVLLPTTAFMLANELQESCCNIFKKCKKSVLPKITFRNKKIQIGKYEKNQVGESTPVLFSTQSGLLLRLVGDSYNNDFPKYTFMLCDYVSSQNNLTFNVSRKTIVEKPTQMNQKMVRFAQSIKEIPISEYMSWTSTEPGESLNTIELNTVVTST